MKNMSDCGVYKSEICEHYQGKPVCNYGVTHGVTTCPFGKLSPKSSEFKEKIE